MAGFLLMQQVLRDGRGAGSATPARDNVGVPGESEGDGFLIGLFAVIGMIGLAVVIWVCSYGR